MKGGDLYSNMKLLKKQSNIRHFDEIKLIDN